MKKTIKLLESIYKLNTLRISSAIDQQEESLPNLKDGGLSALESRVIAFNTITILEELRGELINDHMNVLKRFSEGKV